MVTPIEKAYEIMHEKKEPEILTVADVADLLRVSTMTVYRLIKSGDLEAIFVSKRSYRIRASVLKAYLESHTTKTEKSE